MTDRTRKPNILLFVATLPLLVSVSNAQDQATPQQSATQPAIRSLSKIELPTEKKEHPPGYYAVWKTELKEDLEFLESDDTRHWAREIKHWGRFLWYFKMVPDDPSQILAVFMDSYEYDKHNFCAEYNDCVPRLVSGEHQYCLEYYKTVMPVMDEIVRLVLDSYDKELIELIKQIEVSDQSIRADIPDDASPEKQSELLAKQRIIDIENLKQIKSVIAKHGYPGRSLVGIKYEKVAFLVIQHNGGEAIEKHLPIIKAAIDNNDLNPNVYPYLFDRLEVSKGRPQHFGTQSKLEPNELFPVHDPENLDRRRAKYGLPALNKGSSNQ